jgi:hypothetical protein
MRLVSTRRVWVRAYSATADSDRRAEIIDTELASKQAIVPENGK